MPPRPHKRHFSPPGRGCANFRGEASFSTWLYRLTSNACVDSSAAGGPPPGRRRSLLNDEESESCTCPTTPPVPRSRQTPGAAEQIETALQALTPEHRQVLVLREMHQLSYDEIAQVLKLDVGTVKSRINRGRKQLRNFFYSKAGTFSARCVQRIRKGGLTNGYLSRICGPAGPVRGRRAAACGGGAYRRIWRPAVSAGLCG